MGFVLVCYEFANRRALAYERTGTASYRVVTGCAIEALLVEADVGCYIVDQSQAYTNVGFDQFKYLGGVKPSPTLEYSSTSHTANGPAVKPHRERVKFESVAEWVRSALFEFVSIDVYVDMWRQAGASVSVWNGEELVRWR